MMETIEQAADRHIGESIEQLQASSRGRKALANLRAWLEDDCLIGLDCRNQEAVSFLLVQLWGGRTGAASEAIRNATGEPEAVPR